MILKHGSGSENVGIYNAILHRSTLCLLIFDNKLYLFLLFPADIDVQSDQRPKLQTKDPVFHEPVAQHYTENPLWLGVAQSVGASQIYW